jgi:hypothetical protein
MPDLFLRNLRVGGRSFDIRFTRGDDGTTWEVVRGDRRRVALRSMAVGENSPVEPLRRG